MELQEDDRRFSFSYDVCGEKLRLIDVSKEDDFLIDSPLIDSLEDLRLSVTFDSISEPEAIGWLRAQSSKEGNSTEEMTLHKENNLSPSGAMQPGRPSYLRESLAWDSAFFNSAGVLDPEELTFINRGLEAVENKCMGRAETSTVIGARNIGICHENKIETCLASQRRRIQKSEKTKTEHKSRREAASLKPPKATERVQNLLRGRSLSSSLNAYNGQIQNKTANKPVLTGKEMMRQKKSALLNSCSLPSGHRSSPTFSPFYTNSTDDNTVTLSPYDTVSSGLSSKVNSALVRGTPESRKNKLRASTSASESCSRFLTQSEKWGHPWLSTLSRSISNNRRFISPVRSSVLSFSGSTTRSKKQCNESKAHCDTSMALRMDSQDGVVELKTPNISQRKSSLVLQFEEIKSPAETNLEALVASCPLSTEPRKKFKPSGLRQPSPKIGFFDEEKTMLSKANRCLQSQCERESMSPYDYGTINRKRPAKPLLDVTSPKNKTSKHSQGSPLLRSAPGTKARSNSSNKKIRNFCPRESSTTKSWSDVALRRQTRKCIGIIEGASYKSRKVDARVCDHKRIGQITGLKGDDDQRQVKGKLKNRLGKESKGQRDEMRIQRELRNQSMKEKSTGQETIDDDLHLLNEDKIRTSTWEDQVNNLSSYLDIIDLSKDMAIEFKGKGPCSQNGDSSTEDHVCANSPLFDRKNIYHGQQAELPPDCNRSSLLKTDIVPSSRTPLADKTSLSNQNGSDKPPEESAKGISMVKASALSSFEGIDKENV